MSEKKSNSENICKFCKKLTIFIELGGRTIEEPITDKMIERGKELKKFHGDGWDISYSKPSISYTVYVCVKCGKISVTTYNKEGWVNSYSTREDSNPW